MQIPATGSMVYNGVNTPNQGAEITMEINSGSLANVQPVATNLAQVVSNGGFQASFRLAPQSCTAAVL